MYVSTLLWNTEYSEYIQVLIWVLLLKYSEKFAYEVFWRKWYGNYSGIVKYILFIQPKPPPHPHLHPVPKMYIFQQDAVFLVCTEPSHVCL